MGTPYRWIQKSKAPIRMFFQLNKLRFHPVANADYISNWKDLDGKVMYSHGPGSGTEATLNMLAKQNNIKYSEMKYIPGSGVRAKAMIRKQILATVVDTQTRNSLLHSKKGHFKILPMKAINASDEALYANKNFIDNNQEVLKILIEELLFVWHKINQSPEYAIDARNKYHLLSNLSEKKAAKTLGYYTEMVEVEAFPSDGGQETAFQSDLDFYSYAGTIKGDINNLSETDFWDFEILRKILTDNNYKSLD